MAPGGQPSGVKQGTDRNLPAGCTACQNLRIRNAALWRDRRMLAGQLRKAQAELAGAREEIRELQERLRINASNSSLPPSANPIGAASPVVKRPTGRRRGAQPGHRGASRAMVPPEQVDEVIEHRPGVCPHCSVALSPDAVSEEQIVGRHQVAELPPRAVVITEHRSIACRCPACGNVNRGQIPAEIRRCVIGPRLTAAIGLFGSRVYGSHRAIAQVLRQVLGCPVALGSIGARERELSEALAGPCGRLVGQVAGAPVKYVDETGWKTRGRGEHLFVAATAGATVFRVQKSRHRPALGRLLNGTLTGVFCTDRFTIYDQVPLDRRGLCWAHLKRDFLRCMERGGVSETIGRTGVNVSRKVFGLWRKWKRGTLDRQALQAQAETLQRELHEALATGAASGIARTTGLCKHLLEREQALWNWTRVPGLEPSNNLAERMLRPAVIWRKKSFGRDSRGGSQFVERILSVVQTLSLRGHEELPYLAKAITAHRRGTEVPPVPECQDVG